MAKAEATVEELVKRIERGELRLPEMQRRYVWRSTRVRDLLDSLYRGYPSGAILIWDTDEDVPLQDMAVEQEASPYRSTQLLLDGQQRLTSLSAVIRGQPVSVRGRKRPIELLFNLDHPDDLAFITEVEEDDGAEEDDERIDDEADSSDDELQRRFDRMTFVVATGKLARRRNWVKVSEVFRSDGDAEFLENAGVTNVKDPLYKKYSERLARLRAIKKYVYRMDVLERSLSYDEVTEIFVRVNSLGAKLRSSDLALAQITARWKGALKTFQAFQDECTATGFDLGMGIHLKNLVAFGTGQSRFLRVGSLRVETLQKAWSQCVPGMEFAINFLRSNIGLESHVLLSSPFLLVTLAYYGYTHDYQMDADTEAQLRYWVLLANAKGRYSRGSSETLLDQDLATLRDGGDINDLIERLRLQVGRLDITPEELEGRNQRSALFKTMYLAFREKGARDWQSNLVIGLSHRGSQHKLQFHHIFPKALLRRHHYGAREADDIANFAFIGGKTNRQIRDRAPKEYFPALMEKFGEAPFRDQCIPTDPELLDIEAYQKFLAERRRQVSEGLNRFLNSGSQNKGSGTSEMEIGSDSGSDGAASSSTAVTPQPDGEAHHAPRGGRPGSHPVYELTLQRSYYDKGFFNLGVAVERYLRKDNGRITIRLGGSGRVISASLSRDANVNGTPRIVGGSELRNWFQRECKCLDVLAVEVISPTEIAMSAKTR